jgi:hypothetical protein
VVVLTPDRDLMAMVGDAVAEGADSLGVAGGDGSLALVAAAAVANGLLFTCVHGEAVRRPQYRGAKLLTLLETADEVLGPSAAVSESRLVDDLGHEHTDPVVVLVSNNPYALDRPQAPSTRPRLDSGRLGVMVLDAPGVGRGPRGRAWGTQTLMVDAAGPVHAGIDGEAVDLSPPLEFVIRPAALRVRVPAHRPDGVAPRPPWPVGPATRGSTGGMPVGPRMSSGSGAIDTGAVEQARRDQP